MKYESMLPRFIRILNNYKIHKCFSNHLLPSLYITKALQLKSAEIAHKFYTDTVGEKVSKTLQYADRTKVEFMNAQFR
jgi:hypothetical protein